MISTDYFPEAVILANGSYPVHPRPLQLLAEAPLVACCDGAADTYIDKGHIPDLIIGDGDSISEANKVRFAPIIHRFSEQESNDQTKAVRHLQALGIRRIAITGATGKREDHTLGNISLLIDYMKAGMEVRMFTDHGTFIPAKNEQSFAAHPGQQVSIFNFGARGLYAEGLIYPLSDFTHWWQGTLNEACGACFTIRAEGPYLVFLAY